MLTIRIWQSGQIEVDLRKAADGKLIVMHDDTVNQKPDCESLVENKALKNERR
jgi:glycerophosphoryl diester phosphodiesterase